MNPAARRKFNEVGVDTDGERCAKFPKFEFVVSEKDLNAPAGPAVAIPFGDRAAQNPPMQVPSQVCPPHEVMDCTVSPDQPNSMGQQNMTAVASADAGGRSLAPSAPNGACLQCYYGQSGHFHHIETRIFPPGNQ